MRMLNGSSTPNTSLPTPQALDRSLPISATSARPSSTSTRHRADSSISRDCVNSVSPVEVEPVVSSVSATLTSDVVIKSTEMLWRARMPNTSAKKPRECSIFRLCSVSSVCLRRSASARNSGGFAVLLHTSVPPAFGSLLEPTNTGISLRTAGNNVAGCSTFAPKVAISAASSKAISSIRCAAGTTRGSVV